MDAPLTQQVEAPLNSNPCHSRILESSKSGLVSIVPKWRMGDREVDAPLSQSMASAQQVEAPLNSNPCHLGAFSATKCSDIIKHHGSLSGIGSASTLSGVAGPMDDFSSTKCSDIIEHHRSLIGIGSGDFPPRSPFVKVVSGKQKAVLQAVTPSGEANASHYAPTKHVFNAIYGASFPDVQGDALLSCVIPALSQPIRSVSSSGKVGKCQGVAEDALSTGVAKASQNWRSLFVNRPKPCTPLVYSNPSRVDGKVIINPPSEAVEEGLGIWEGCLVG